MVHTQECDDGNLVDGDGCSKTCQLEAGWVCDGRGCGTDTCQPICGDGRLLGKEQCDSALPGCTPLCYTDVGFGTYSNTPTAVCGDGVWAGAEVLFSFWRAVPLTVLPFPEACLPHVGYEHTHCCVALCALCQLLNLRLVQLLQECDDGNRAASDGCSASCSIEEVRTVAPAKG